MYRTSNFEQGTPPQTPIEIPTDLEIGEMSLPNEIVTFSYGPTFEIQMKMELSESPGLGLFVGSGEPNIKPRDFPECTKFLCLSRKFNSDGSGHLIFKPQTEPALSSLSGEANSVEAVVLNGPDLRLGGLGLELASNGVKFRYSQFESAKNRFQDMSLPENKFFATGMVTIEREDLATIPPSDAWRILYRFARALSFVRGGSCGIGHATGLNKHGRAQFQYLGFSQTDELAGKSFWYDLGCRKDLPDFIRTFTIGLGDDRDGAAILRASEFYRVANSSEPKSREIAIAASQTALEVLVFHILKSRAGWSKSLLNDRISFHDKLRAAASFVSLQSDPLEHSDRLSKRAKSFNGADGFQMLTKVRNSIVHAEQDRSFSGIELYETWQLSQWLCEVLIFFLIGYRGVMADRRVISGWRGQHTGPVPLEKV
ncbi:MULTISPECIES: hypothetical protein [Roseovarius]|uniref:hypothetical protein n=1 Tax=Roseovarius TaxID=74030 RepID=UPI00273D5EAB|nr:MULTISPECIES: hypothetical protein [unclassified Roseovarius]